MSVRKNVNLHEDTVQDVAAGRIKGKKRKRNSPRPASSPVQTLTVDRKLWAVVLKQAGGDPSRIQIISSREVHIS